MGKITDADSKPLSSVTVNAKGSNISVVSGDDGSFLINVPDKAGTLRISSIGFETQEVSISGKNNLSIQLKSSNSTLNEVVVTGYSAQRKKDITGSVSVVNAKELIANPGSNVEGLLQGKAAGVTVGTSGYLVPVLL